MLRRCWKTTTSATEYGTIRIEIRSAEIAGAGIVGVALLILSARPAGGAALADDDNSPLIVTIGLPSATEGASLLPKGGWAWQLSTATASHSTQDSAAGERLLFDGETTRFAFSVQHAFSDRLQLGLNVPWLLHESGNLDSVVEQWHSWFGFPDGVRDLVASDQIDFRYEDAGVLRLDQQSRARGPGDIRVLAAWQLRQRESSSTALRASVKLPTGDSGKLTGSGGTDISIGIAGDYSQLFGHERFAGFYRAHLVLVGKPDRLPDRARTAIGKLSGGLSFSVNSVLDLNAQASIRTAAYESDTRLLGDTAVLLNVGGHIRLGERLRLAISVGEDVRVDTAPDVTFGLALQYDSGR